MKRDWDALFSPRSVMIVGASSETSTLAGRMLAELDRFGYPGAIYLVNRNRTVIGDRTSWPSIDAVHEETVPELAVINLRAEAAVDAVETCARIGVRAVIVIAAGFAEVGEAGGRLQERLSRIAADSGMIVVGPNTAGLLNTYSRFICYGTSGAEKIGEFARGTVAIVSQSGALGYAILSLCLDRGVHVARLISTGNEAVIDASEYVDYLAGLPEVEVILCYLDAIRNPERFFEAADVARARGVRVIVLKGGRTEVGQRVAWSHTAALGGPTRALQGAMRQRSIVEVHDLDELVDAAVLLSRVPASRIGPRIGVVSLAGGGASVAADQASDAGLELPNLGKVTVERLTSLGMVTVDNPLDLGAGFSRDGTKLEAALDAVLQDASIDMVLFLPFVGDAQYGRSIADVVASLAKRSPKPVLCLWVASPRTTVGVFDVLADASVPVFTNMRRSFEVLRAVTRDGARDHPRPSSRKAVEPQRARPPFTDAADLLRGFDIPLARRMFVRSAREARAFAATVDGPVVVKIESPDLPHRAAVGGVILSVQGPDQAAAAYDAVVLAGLKANPNARIDGAEIQEMVHGGFEVLLGVHTDPLLGHQLTVGVGGVWAEDIHDTAIRPLPIDQFDAEQMLDELAAYRVFDRAGGRIPLDRGELVRCMMALSALSDAYSGVDLEIDINPLLVMPAGKGAVAVDWLVRLDGRLVSNER